MSTIVLLHAHPDDEASSTGGTIALATRAGHRCVTVFATNGDHGEVPGDLADGETLVDRRRTEAARSAEVLGTQRIVWLDYADSGMTGWEGNSHEQSFMQAPLEEAAARLAAVLDEEQADVLVTYDWHGNYGHPDHVKVHPVAYRAAELAGRRPRVLEVSLNRDEVQRYRELMQAAGEESDFDPNGPGDDGNGIGLTEAQLHWRVDIDEVWELKREALLCHASQTTDITAITSVPREFWHSEWFREHGRPIGVTEGLPF